MKKNTGSNIFLYTSIIVFLLPILVTIYEWINYKGKMFGEIEILGFIFYAFMVVLVWLISLFFLLFHFYYKKNAGSKVIDTISRPENQSNVVSVSESAAVVTDIFSKYKLSIMTLNLSILTFLIANFFDNIGKIMEFFGVYGISDLIFSPLSIMISIIFYIIFLFSLIRN
jgi:hypothetical protein